MKLCFLADGTKKAQLALKGLVASYGECLPEDSDVLVPLGGDGFLLRTIHHYRHLEKPIYGMNCGNLGFMMNAFTAEELVLRIATAQAYTLFPLSMIAKTTHGEIFKHIALNEVSLLRVSPQAARIRIFVDGVERLHELVCDGVLVSTPLGSTAYNFSVHGPIVPLNANLVALTPISPFRPRHWRGALLPGHTKFEFEILEGKKRTISAFADTRSVNDVVNVTVSEDRALSFTLLFDKDNSVEEKVLREQFAS